MSKVNKERHPREGHLNEQRFAENLQCYLWNKEGTDPNGYVTVRL